MRLPRFVLACALLSVFASSTAYAAEDPADIGAHKPSQAAADVIKDFAASDGAFLAAGLVKESYQKDNLASLLMYPTDHLVVVNLSGAQIRQAFERSVSLYPQPNSSFLQISGFEVSFSRKQPPNARVLSVTLPNGAKLEDAKTYTVAMPSALQRGALGYFKIWDKATVVRKYESSTLEEVLKAKPFVETPSRWLPQG